MNKTHIIDGSSANDYYLASDVDAELAALRAERDELRDVVIEIAGWISNWEPDFVEDDEWAEVEKRIDAALKVGEA